MFFGNTIKTAYVSGARVIESSTSEHGSEGLRESLHEVYLPVPVRQLLRVIPGTFHVEILGLYYTIWGKLSDWASCK